MLENINKLISTDAANAILFVAFPYVAIVLAILIGIYRYKKDAFSYSSFSSQFLENRTLFFGSVPWHYGIIIILMAHIIAALFPGVWQQFISEPMRLYVLEVTGLALALMTIIGLALLIIRRLSNTRIKIVTSTMDWVLLGALLVQIVLGFSVALFYRWGSDWYLHTVVPWLYSLAKLTPQVQYVSQLPVIVKLHIFGGFLVILLFPFTRLVHLITVPIGYLWRPYQVVIWNKRQSQQQQQ